MLDKDYNTKIISEEIKKLFTDLDKVIEKRNDFVQDIRKAYLNMSSNN